MNFSQPILTTFCFALAVSCSQPQISVGPSSNPSGATNVSTQQQSSTTSAKLIRRERPFVAEMRGNPSSFEEWKSLFRARALASGITQSTLDRAAPFMTYKERVVNNDRNQNEFKQTVMDYVNKRVEPVRINAGHKALKTYGAAAKRIAQAYGVDESVLLGIWGLETAFGSFMGGTNVITSMSTLAYEGRRRDWAEKQLVWALLIVQNGERSPEKMEGSWAAGMGHTQFIPEMYHIYAIDFSGDGVRDVWNPIDALASTANFLRNESTAPNLPWGAEVRLPAGFNTAEASLDHFKDASYWKSKGVTAVSKRGMPNAPLAIYIPEGSNGRAFAVTSNFKYIKRYNNSNAYALAVALLGDTVLGLN